MNMCFCYIFIESSSKTKQTINSFNLLEYNFRFIATVVKLFKSRLACSYVDLLQNMIS